MQSTAARTLDRTRDPSHSTHPIMSIRALFDLGKYHRDSETTQRERRSHVLSDDEILSLGGWAVAVEAHYGRAMDMEWAKDGETGELYIVQARPETVQSVREAGMLKTYRLKERGKVLLRGSAIGESIATGTVCVIRSAADIARFHDGAVLVTEMTDPDWVPIMKRAAGIVTDHGGTTSHAATSSQS